MIDQTTKIQSELKALRFQKNFGQSAKKQLIKARTRSSNAVKAKDKAAKDLKTARGAVVKALELQDAAVYAHQEAVAEDAEADQEVRRLEAIVRSKQGRQSSDPISLMMQQLQQSVASMPITEDAKTLVMQSIQVAALTSKGK